MTCRVEMKTRELTESEQIALELALEKARIEREREAEVGRLTAEVEQLRNQLELSQRTYALNGEELKSEINDIKSEYERQLDNLKVILQQREHENSETVHLLRLELQVQAENEQQYRQKIENLVCSLGRCQNARRLTHYFGCGVSI